MSLVNRKSDGMSLVQIEYHGVKGTVCAREFNNEDGFVVCRSISSKDKIQVATSIAPYITDKDLPILIGGVKCLGSEVSLDDCIKGVGIGNTNCSVAKAAVGIKCEPQSKGDNILHNIFCV